MGIEVDHSSVTPLFCTLLTFRLLFEFWLGGSLLRAIKMQPPASRVTLYEDFLLQTSFVGFG